MSTNESQNSSPAVSKSEVTVKTPMSSFVKGGFGFGCGCLLFILFVFFFLPAACSVLAVPAFNDAAKRAKQNTQNTQKSESANEKPTVVEPAKQIDASTTTSVKNMGQITTGAVSVTPVPAPYVYSEAETAAYNSWFNAAQYWSQKYKESQTTSDQAEAKRNYDLASANCNRIKNGEYSQLLYESIVAKEQAERQVKYARIYEAVQIGKSTGLVTKIEKRMSGNAIKSIQVNGVLWAVLDLDTKKNVITSYAIYSVLLEGKTPEKNMPSGFEVIDNKSGEILGGYSMLSGEYVGSK